MIADTVDTQDAHPIVSSRKWALLFTRDDVRSLSIFDAALELVERLTALSRLVRQSSISGSRVIASERAVDTAVVLTLTRGCVRATNQLADCAIIIADRIVGRIGPRELLKPAHPKLKAF